MVRTLPVRLPRFRVGNDALALAQEGVDPLVREVAALDRGTVGCLGFPSALEPHEELLGDLPGDDNDAVEVPKDDVPRLDDDAAALDRIVDLPRAAVERADGRDAAGVDREPQGHD